MSGAIPRVAWLTAAILAGASIVAPRPSAAKDATAIPPAWLDEVTLNGFLSTSYSFNSNRPNSLLNQFRVFDFDDNTFKLDAFELVAQKAASKFRDSGFRVDLAAGGSIPRVSAAAGLFRDATGTAEDIDLQQAYLSYVAPAGSGLRLDAGKFITGHGYEVIEGYDGWNDNATRSFLFGYAIPFTHLGVRAAYTFTPRVSGMFMIVNGWDVARDNNRSKSIGAQLTMTPSPALTLILSGMTGPERTANESDARSLLDAVAIWNVGPRLTLGANADLAGEQNAVAPGRDGRWSGLAGYARIASHRWFALSLRGEYFDDMDGVRTGTPQALAEFTATPEMRLTPHLLVRADLRQDHSNRSVFEKGRAFVKTQPTALFGAIYSF
jgi:hypothetical protein